jgi:putative addiction module component (TIGR02574 family)
MDRTTELALVCTYVYDRARVNRVGIPSGWQVAQVASGQEAYLKDDSVGLSAGAFLDANGNIVIAFTGTNEFADWIAGNLPAALGAKSPQVQRALAFVSEVLDRYAISIEEITKEVVELPRHQRLALVRLLLDLDQPGATDDIEQAWDEEIRARVKAVDEGRANGIPYEEIKNELAGRFGPR